MNEMKGKKLANINVLDLLLYNFHLLLAQELMFFSFEYLFII
jgi:hypothetical protein